MTERERLLEKIRKVQALANRGADGEKQSAAALLDNRERLLGDYSPGRFAWVLQNPVMFKTPIPAHGKQGWWNWEEPT